MKQIWEVPHGQHIAGITARPAEYGRRVLAFFDHALLPTDQGGHTMRIEQSFSVSQPPEVVFDYLTNPANLGAWQTSKTSVEQLTTGAPQLGTRVRERTKGPRGKEFDQIVEFTEFERPAHVHAHIVEGPYPVDGAWSFAADDAGTRVHFVAEGELPGVPRLLQPLAKRLIARQMAGYHNNLCRNLEAGDAPAPHNA